MLWIPAVILGLAAAAGAGVVQFRQVRHREELEIRASKARGELMLPKRVGASGVGLPLIAYNCLLFLAMVAGIFAKYFWEHGFAGPLDLNGLWKPILITPIVFLPVYVAATKQPKGLIPVLLAFQNGFFWQTILESSAPRVP